MEDILKQIVEHKKSELERTKSAMPLSLLKERMRDLPPARDFRKAISPDHMTIIAELKRASPSRGILCADFDAPGLAEAYEKSGAAAISVLTESAFFLGKLEYLETVKQKTTIPLLRKDFIFDSYQVYESRAYGADALLLIAAILDAEQLSNLIQLSWLSGIDCLVEVHNEIELEKALSCGADIIGINNRDLNTFITDIEVTGKLRGMIPANVATVSESGISGKNEITILKQFGVNAILVGEALVTAANPGARLEEMTKLLG